MANLIDETANETNPNLATPPQMSVYFLALDRHIHSGLQRVAVVFPGASGYNAIFNVVLALLTVLLLIPIVVFPERFNPSQTAPEPTPDALQNPRPAQQHPDRLDRRCTAPIHSRRNHQAVPVPQTIHSDGHIATELG